MTLTIMMIMTDAHYVHTIVPRNETNFEYDDDDYIEDNDYYYDDYE